MMIKSDRSRPRFGIKNSPVEMPASLNKRTIFSNVMMQTISLYLEALIGSIVTARGVDAMVSTNNNEDPISNTKAVE